MARIESMAPLGRAQITYMFLGEHTHAQAHKIITDSTTLSGTIVPPSSHSNNNYNNNNNNNNKTTVPATVSTSAALSTKKNVPNDVGQLSGANSHDGGLFSLSYFYPVLPIEYIIPPPVTTTSMMMTTTKGEGNRVTTDSSSTGTGAGANGITTGGGSSSGGGGVGSSGTVVEAIVGNDVQDVLLVPRESEPPRGMSRWKGVGLRRQDVAALQQQQQPPPPLSSSQSSSEYRPLFVLQGNFGGKHAHRRDPKGMYDNDCNIIY